jgi:hypothetical protein
VDFARVFDFDLNDGDGRDYRWIGMGRLWHWR